MSFSIFINSFSYQIQVHIGYKPGNHIDSLSRILTVECGITHRMEWERWCTGGQLTEVHYADWQGLFLKISNSQINIMYKLYTCIKPNILNKSHVPMMRDYQEVKHINLCTDLRTLCTWYFDAVRVICPSMK